MSFLQRLFKREKQDQPPVAYPTTLERDRVIVEQFQIGQSTDIGKQRQHNEDAILVIESSQGGDSPQPPFGLVVLADGMGGHQSGEVASALASREMARHIVQQIYLNTLNQFEHTSDQPSLNEVLIEAVNMANSTVSKTVPGGGTTLLGALVMGSQAYIANVGDSRAYLVSPEGLKQITRDHSLVDRLVELGQLTEEEAVNHPQKNVLYRAVGQGGVLEVDTFAHTISPENQLLLCSDGLWGMLDEREMAQIIAEAPSPQIACNLLTEAANQAGGKDNISVILVKPPVTP